MEKSSPFDSRCIFLEKPRNTTNFGCRIDITAAMIKVSSPSSVAMIMKKDEVSPVLVANQPNPPQTGNPPQK